MPTPYTRSSAKQKTMEVDGGASGSGGNPQQQGEKASAAPIKPEDLLKELMRRNKDMKPYIHEDGRIVFRMQDVYMALYGDIDGFTAVMATKRIQELCVNKKDFSDKIIIRSKQASSK